MHNWDKGVNRMNENNIELLNKVEISSEIIEQRILELKNIINMKINYREQINLIEKLIMSKK